MGALQVTPMLRLQVHTPELVHDKHIVHTNQRHTFVNCSASGRTLGSIASALLTRGLNKTGSCPRVDSVTRLIWSQETRKRWSHSSTRAYSLHTHVHDNYQNCTTELTMELNIQT